MVQYDCEVKAILRQVVFLLKSSEERDNVVAILVIAEVSPSSLPTGALWPLGSRPGTWSSTLLSSAKPP